MITFAMKCPKELRQFPWKAEYRLCLECLQQKTLNRQLRAPEVKAEIKDMIVHLARLRWLICSEQYKREGSSRKFIFSFTCLCEMI